MQNLSSPQENAASENEYSVIQGYNICLLFLEDLGLLIMPYTSSLDKETIADYDLFFASIWMGFECFAEWSKAIYRVKKIKKEDQKNMILNLQDIFLCTIELCKVFSEWWKVKIEYLINLLEAIRNEPQKHSTEWSLWKKAVNDVIYKNQSIVADFDWDFEWPK